MDCCSKSNFWIGLGLGAVLGAVCCHVSRTQQAKELKNKLCDAMHKMGDKTTEMWNNAKDKVTEKVQEVNSLKN